LLENGEYGISFIFMACICWSDGCEVSAAYEIAGYKFLELSDQNFIT
jgi:hypothetical protein